MQAGTLRHSLTLQAPTRRSDGDGGYTESLTNLTPATVRAAIETASVQQIERLFGGTVEATVSHIVTIRYHPQVSTQTRILFGTRTFRVGGVLNVDERNIEMKLACQEIVS